MSYSREDLAAAIRGSNRLNEQQAEINHWINLLHKAIYLDDYEFPRSALLVVPIAERPAEIHLEWCNREYRKDYSIRVVSPRRRYVLYEYGSRQYDALPLELVTPTWEAMPSFLTGICKNFPEMGRTIDFFITAGKS